jgi:hypothetical protein
MPILDLDMFDNATCGELPQSAKHAPGSADSSSAPFLTDTLDKGDKPAGSLLSRSIAEMTPESLEQTKGSPVAGRHLEDFSSRGKAKDSTSEMEKAFLGEDSASNGDGSAIVPDSTDYTYHEEDEEDDASIHHGSDVISVADYQSDRPSSGTSRSAPVDDASPDSVLPAHLNDLLEQWYLRHGRTAPKCTCKRSESHMSELWYPGNSRTPVTWLHRSGVPLEVTWYPLPGTEEVDGKYGLKLIVVSGPGVPPSIVSYMNAGGSIAGIKERGVVYRIWRGLSGDQDGFEPSPSVIKLSRGTDKPKLDRVIVQLAAPAHAQSYGPNGSEPAIRCDYCIMLHRSCDRKQPTCSRCASKGRRCHYRDDSLSRPGMRRLQVGAGTSSNGLDLQRSNRVRKPTTRYTTEELAPTKKRKLEHSSFDEDDDDEGSDVLLSKFMTSPQLVSTSTPASRRASKSKPWVCYLCDDTATYKSDMRSHFREEHGMDPDENRLKLADSRAETQKAQPVMTTRNTRGVRGSQRTLEIESTPDAEEVCDLEFGEHIKKNTKVMFFSRTQAPRIRLFSACDSVHKLFAQATAGDVFSRERGRVLAVEVEDQESELPIVEDDEEDFELFVECLRDASCWITGKGQIEGETVVHVREKRK